MRATDYVRATETKKVDYPVRQLVWDGKKNSDRGVEITLPDGSTLLLVWLYVSPAVGPCAYMEVLAKMEPDRPHGALMDAVLHRVHPLSSPKFVGMLDTWVLLGKDGDLREIVLTWNVTKITLSFSDAYDVAGMQVPDVKNIPVPVAERKLAD